MAKASAGFGVVLIVLGAVFGYYYLQSSSTISSLNQTVNSRAIEVSQKNTLISNLNATIVSNNAKIANDTAKIANLTSTITSLQSQVQADEARINSLLAKNAQENQTIASLNSQIASLNSQIASYQSQVSSLQAQVSQLQAQVGLYQTATNYLNAALSASLTRLYYSNYQFSVPSGTQEFFSFGAGTVGGYLLVGVVTSTSQNTIVSVSTSTVNVGNSGVALFYIPAQTSFDLDIYDQNSNSFSATMNVWFFYS